LKLTEADRIRKEGWEAAVARSATLLDALAAHEVQPLSRSDIPTDLDEINSYLQVVASQVDQLVAELSEIEDDLAVCSLYLPVLRELAPVLAQLEQSRYLAGTAFMVPSEEYETVSATLDDALSGRVILAPRARGKELLIIAAVLKTDRDLFATAIGRAGLSEITLPERYSELGVAKAAHVMEERSQSLPKRRNVVVEELDKLKAQHGAKLRAVYQVAGNHQARFDRLQDMVEGKYSFALRGWVPSADRVRVVDGLRKQFGDDIAVEARAADEHHDRDVPVKLDNPTWVKPFEGLLALFAPPKYGSFDPSWTLAVFFPFFFGLVVGDIGFALMFAAIGGWLRRRGQAGKAVSLGPLRITIKPLALTPISTVIFWCAAWSAVFGFLYGEFFGNLLERFPAAKPVFYTTLHEAKGHGLIDIILFRVEVFTPLLLLSIGFGVLQVLGGWLIRVIYGFRHHDMKHVFEGVGMFSGLLGIVIFATAFLTQNLNPVVNGIVIVALAVFLLCTVLAKMPLMLIELVSNSGNILSFLRLFAVGLSAALVANLATDLGFSIGRVLPVLGPILGIVVGLAVHLIALTLTIIGHTLQPLRLQYVEFFTKFGFYDDNGRPYQPFRLLGGKS
jgi:V/A-type H+-transporting ATPase subunit I